MKKPTKRICFEAVAKSLVEFGYPDVTTEMVADTWEAMLSGSDIPHRIVGRFAQAQLAEHRDFIEGLPA